MKNHKHNYKDYGNYFKCDCGKRKLKLFKEDREGVRYGVTKTGIKIQVREDRRRYFFPDEWEIFIKQFKNKTHRFFFITLLHTGARIMEALHLKHKDIDVERGSVIFNIVKQRSAKKNIYAVGKSRNFFVAENFIKEYKSFTRGEKINNEDYIFLDNSKLPENYDALSNKEKSKYYYSKLISYSTLLKRKLKKAGIKDYYNFSPHNIRKTYGMWMRTFNIVSTELCYRMGHDIDTYIAHYGSSLIFTEAERRKISKILGEVK